MFQKHLEKKGEVYICRHATSCSTKRRTELINGLLRLGHTGPRDLFCHLITEEELICTNSRKSVIQNKESGAMSTKSETGLGILFSDLALRISLNFTWN